MRRFEDGFWWENMGRIVYGECETCGHSVKRGTYYGVRHAMEVHFDRTHSTSSLVYKPPSNVTVIEPGEEAPF